MSDSNRSEKLSYIGVITAIVLGLYLGSLHSYLLFHSLVEITTIAIGFTLFILTWNARRLLANNFLSILGIGYAFIALIDLLHTLAYKGMNVFPGFGANLPTQLWIAARYLQAVTLCAAPLFVERRVDNRAIFGGYAAAVSVLVAMVFSGNFPDCYIEGKGLTTFQDQQRICDNRSPPHLVISLVQETEIFQRQGFLADGLFNCLHNHLRNIVHRIPERVWFCQLGWPFFQAGGFLPHLPGNTGNRSQGAL